MKRAIFYFRYALLWFTALGYISVGILHFVNKDFFMCIMPPYIPFHSFCVLFSGFAEILLGCALLIPAYRRWASYGILALLVAVFPANIYLAMDTGAQTCLETTSMIAIARLPFQAVFALIAWWLGQPFYPGTQSAMVDWFELKGWTISQDIPEGLHRSVVIAAPHTSNWDIIYARGGFLQLGIPLRFAIKSDWIRFPFKRIMTRWGALPIYRNQKAGQAKKSRVEVMAELYNEHKEIAIMVAPEGSRSFRTQWKTGFYYVALQANVPIGLGYLDYQKKEAGIARLLWPSGDIEKDMREIMAFYASISPRYPELFSLDERYAGSSVDADEEKR